MKNSRYSEDNTFYIQFYNTNGDYCIGSDGFIYFCPDRRQNRITQGVIFHETAKKHLENMRSLGKDFTSFKLLTRSEWSKLK